MREVLERMSVLNQNVNGLASPIGKLRGARVLGTLWSDLRNMDILINILDLNYSYIRN